MTHENDDKNPENDEIPVVEVDETRVAVSIMISGLGDEVARVVEIIEEGEGLVVLSKSELRENPVDPTGSAKAQGLLVTFPDDEDDDEEE